MNNAYGWHNLDIRYMNWPVLLMVILFSAAVLIFLMHQDAKRRRITKHISIRPHPLRSLNEDETLYLTKWLNTYNRMLIISSCVFIISVILLIAFITNADIGVYFLFLGIIAAGFIISSIISVRKFRKDLQSDVYETSGEIFKDREITGRYNPSGYYLTIGKVSFHFSAPGNQRLVSFYETVNDGAEVEALYSPNTRHIWSIKKVHEQ